MSQETNLEAYAERARQKMLATAWDYYASGADDERCLAKNRSAFDNYSLHYRVLCDVSSLSLETTLLGQPVAMPIAIAPTAFHRLAHPDGELATARAAARANVLYVLSTLSNSRIEDVCELASAVWFQLYVYRDRKVTQALVERVEAAGAKALVLTVDAPVLGKRERDVKNRFALPDGLRIENMLPAGLSDLPTTPETSGLAAYFASMLDPSLSWADIAWLRGLTRLPLVIKGIVRADDARRAIDHGAQAVWVSNHGGRQLDAAPATIDVVGAVVDAVSGHEIYLDGGVRRGSDVAKALAFGARAVFLGRPILWGLASDGEPGVGSILGLIRNELENTMALCGAASPTKFTRDLLFPNR